MNRSTFIIVKRFMACLLMLLSGMAQGTQHAEPDTVMKGATIEVLQSYKPEVKPAPKPEWEPQLPPADTTHPSLSYDVPQQTLYYTYSSLPLRPLALGHTTESLPFANYVEAGAGNLSTLFLDAGIGGLKGKDYETEIHLHHISQQGNISNQQTALSGIEADGVFHTTNNDWHVFVDGERNQYHYYGGDPAGTSSSSVQQTYTTVKAGVDLSSKDTISDLGYKPAIAFTYFNGSGDDMTPAASEVTAAFNVPFTFRFDDAVRADLGIAGAITELSANATSSANNYVEVLPGIDISGDFSGHALLGLAAGRGGKFYVLPDVAAAYTIPDTRFSLSAGYKADLRQNTYEQLANENPYIVSVYSINQMRRDEVFGAVQGGFGEHLSLTARASWWRFSNLPTFVDTIGMPRQFYIDYDNVSALSLLLGARYIVGKTWSVGATSEFYHFYNGSQLYAWGQPDVKIKGDLTVRPIAKLSVTAYLAILGGIAAKDLNNSVVKLSPAVDIGGNVEYQLVSRLSAFVQLNNILNDKYQRWYGYQAYGLNIYGGLRLKF